MNVAIDYSLGVRRQLRRKFCSFLQSHVICMTIYIVLVIVVFFFVWIVIMTNWVNY